MMNFTQYIKKNSFHEYAVSWVESFDNNKIKGLHFFGNHSKIKNKKKITFKEKKNKFFSIYNFKNFFKKLLFI